MLKHESMRIKLIVTVQDDVVFSGFQRE